VVDAPGVCWRQASPTLKTSASKNHQTWLLYRMLRYDIVEYGIWVQMPWTNYAHVQLISSRTE